jgi:hypothetical protein
MASAHTKTPYRWDETEWFESQSYPGYDDTDSDADSEYAAHGQGEAWGGAHDFREGKSKPEWVAHQLLREVAPKLCATTLFDTPDRNWGRHLAAEGIDASPSWDHDSGAMHHQRGEVELTEPRHRIPKAMPAQWGQQDYGQTQRRKRVNETAGYLSGGASTGVYLPDVPLGVFVEVVDTYLALKELSERERDKVRQYAITEKRDGNDRDIDILKRVVAMVENPSGGDV